MAGAGAEALEATAKLPGATDLPATMLVSNSEVADFPNKERNAFTAAAKARGISVTSHGFTLDAS